MRAGRSAAKKRITSRNRASETCELFEYLFFIADQGLTPSQHTVNYIRPKINYAPIAGNGITSGGDGYAIINGKYYLITAKSTDLGWSGPKDKTLTFMVMGAGMEKVKVQAKWNVSGVDQEKVFSNPPSCNFPGQYFESITATSTEDDTDVTLSILEDGKQIYESKPLKGKGTIEYKRGQ